MTNEYLRNRKKMTAYKRRLAQVGDADPSEVTAVNSMVSEMAWVIEWLKTGRQPGLSRGIDHRGAYRRAEGIVLDEDLFPSLQEPPRRMTHLSDEQRDQALAVLRTLSPKEMRCLIMNAVEGMSEYAIAEKLNISRNTVKTFLRRAKRKIPGAQ